MKTNSRFQTLRDDIHKFLPGKMGWLLLWLIGIPVPILLGLFLIRGCT